MKRWIAGLAAVLLLPACGGGGGSHGRPDPAGTPGDGTPVDPQPISQPPTIRIIAPASGTASPEGSTLTLQAEVTNPSDDIARVDFYEDNRRIGGASTPPYTLSYDLANKGVHQLCAVAVDDKGNAIVASPPVTLFVVQGDDKKGHGHDRKH